VITDSKKLERVLVTDCGSTTTKALLFEKTEEGWRYTARGEAPTTVEEPVADVTVGARNAFSELEELRNIKILCEDSDALPFIKTRDANSGIDLYLSTSSAGGGLQMLVAGVVQSMTAQSATRAALGAGAIVLETLSADDGLEDHERISRIRHLRPDIVLLAGGVDGGSKVHAIELAELIRAANPRPRFGDTLKLPVIYAGNCEAISEVTEILSKQSEVKIVENIRPTLERENLAPAREAIHEFFLSHVMSHSPGYGKLLSWSPVPVMPTPAAVGNMVRTLAEQENLQVLCVDIGGATTDVFSVFQAEGQPPIFNRTVSANYGMSYSIANVLIEAGVENILRWLPYQAEASEVKDRLRNKMIRPTSIPQTKADLMLEHAVCREALRLSLEHHKQLAVGLSGIKKSRSISDIFSQQGAQKSIFEAQKLDLVIGSGGVLSHAPKRLEAALMMLDGFALWGITELAVDSIFMLPHLGVLSSVHPEAATEILFKDCLLRICHSIVPKFPKAFIVGTELAEVRLNGTKVGVLRAGLLERIKSKDLQDGLLQVEPLDRRVDCGNGPAQVVEKNIKIAEEGIIFDGRNRPHGFFSSNLSEQTKVVAQTLAALEIGG
jgi:uncharacterized protein (TIGR01319 family)